MNWCHDCDEGRKMPAQQLTQRQCASQQKPPQPTRKKSAPPSAPKPIVADIPLEPPPADNKKQSVRASSRSKGPFKIVVPATQQTDPLTGRQVAFPLNGSDRPQWLNNPILQEYGEEFAGTQYLLGNVSRSKTPNSKTPYLIEWEATRCGTTPMDGGTVLLGIETAVKLQESNKSPNDTNRKRHPLSARLREKLFEVEDDEVGEHLSSDNDSKDDQDDDGQSINETEPPARSSIKRHFFDLSDLIDTGFNVVMQRMRLMWFKMVYDGSWVEFWSLH